MRRFLALLAGVVGSAASAFPPAPHYTLFGIVRDQVGQTLTAEDAVLIAFKGELEIARTPVDSSFHSDQNYELALRIDQNRGGTALYSDRALASAGAFSLAVEMNGALFYPIEVQGNLTAGTGGERVRLDLNLGADTDGDGLPDIWEQWQLYQAGQYPNAQGVWPIHLLTRDGDFDGDGQNNFSEYVAGTFAGDRTEHLDLAIKEYGVTDVRFEFYGITGKIYAIERTLDLVTWETITFSVNAPGTGAAFLRAAESGIVSAYTPRTTGPRVFYRLTVR